MGNCCLGCWPSAAPPRPASQPPPQPPPDPTSQSTQSPPAPNPTSQSTQSPPAPNSQGQIVDFKQQFGNIKDAAQLNPLIDYIDQLLSSIKKEEQCGQSTRPESSKTREFVTDNVGGASELLDHISTEGEKLHESNWASKLPEEMGKVASKALEGLGKLHWIAVGFSLIAFALERIQKVSSNFEKCFELLDTMFDLAKHLQKQHSLMGENENLNKAVLTIVDGVITCCSCMEQQKFFKYLFASTDDEQLRRIESVIEKVKWELSLMIVTDIQGRTADIQGQTAHILAEIPRQHFDSKYRRPADAVGIDHKVAKVIELLDVGGKAERRAVILYGFGGVGKSTLADCVMSQLDLKAFKHSKIELDEKQSDVTSYQVKLCKYLTGEILQFQDSREGRDKLKEVLEKESTFIFIDNALSKEQIDNLLPSDLALPSDSRMLLTTRDIGVTEELRVRKIDCEKYPVNELSQDAAKEFFREIVKRCQPTDSKILDSDKIDAVAAQCHGVPLLLRVYAQHLARHDDPEVCDEMLDTLRKGDFSYTDHHIGEKLLYVYDKLREEDKDAFLDVCTYFHGWPKRLVSYILRKRELNALLDGALVNIAPYDRVVVHDVLRAMGIKLGKDSRVQTDDDWQRALADKKELKGMWVCDGKRDDVSDIGCERFRAVRVLAFRGLKQLTGECCVSLPKLRYLHIEDPAGELPIFEEMDALQYAIFLYGGEDSPSSNRLCQICKSSSMPNIQTLELHVELIKKFPDDFRFADSLRELDLQGCKSLESLPDGFGTLSALETLNLRGCKNLASLPDGFGTLSALQTLSLRGCTSLASLPHGFGMLKSLAYLNMSHCSNLNTLSDDFEGLMMLTTLDLSYCPNLDDNTMEKLSKLKSLRTLRIEKSAKLKLRWKEMGAENFRFKVEKSAKLKLKLRWKEMGGENFRFKVGILGLEELIQEKLLDSIYLKDLWWRIGGHIGGRKDLWCLLDLNMGQAQAPHQLSYAPIGLKCWIKRTMMNELIEKVRKFQGSTDFIQLAITMVFEELAHIKIGKAITFQEIDHVMYLV